MSEALKTKTVRFRATEKEKQELEQRANAVGLSVSSYVRLILSLSENETLRKEIANVRTT